MMNRFKQGDTVAVISGKDKGKKGKVIKIIGSRVVVEKVNVARKHQKPTKNFQGGIIEKPMGIDISNVMPVCPKCSEAVRVRHEKIEDKSVRKCVACGESMDKVK